MKLTLFNRIPQTASRAGALALCIAGILMLRCTPPWGDETVRGPETYAYHTHRLLVFVKSVNSDADTIGVAHALLRARWLDASRPHVPAGGRTSASMLLDPPVTLSVGRSDTSFLVCTTEVQHFVGYQQKFRGDTTRLCVMDGAADWAAAFFLSDSLAVLDSGDTVSISGSHTGAIPDTIRADRDIELELVFDMSRLFTWRILGGQPVRDLVLHGDAISCHER